MGNRTIRIYDTEPHAKEFDAKVLGCHAENGAFYVELDKTAFFPEGGGQAADTGTLNGIKVTDVQEKGGVILHKVNGEIAEGTAVHGVLDWEQRFVRMQNHSGEHIVSGTINRLFGYNNVGFHMDESVTLDVDGTLDAEQIAEVERISNEAVVNNVPITITYPTDEELSSMTYRSKLEGLENTRIVTVEGYDCCACCAPHVERTGEIGVIKILNTMRIAEGTRVFIACGWKAYEDYRKKHELNKEIMGILSAKTYDTADAVQHLLDNYNELKKANKALSEEKALLSLSEIKGREDGFYFTFAAGLSSEDIRFCINHCMEQGYKNIAVFAGNDASGYRFAVSCGSDEAYNGIKELLKGLNGRGGGSNAFFQGQVKSDRASIENALMGFSL